MLKPMPRPINQNLRKHTDWSPAERNIAQATFAKVTNDSAIFEYPDNAQVRRETADLSDSDWEMLMTLVDVNQQYFTSIGWGIYCDESRFGVVLLRDLRQYRLQGQSTIIADTYAEAHAILKDFTKRVKANGGKFKSRVGLNHVSIPHFDPDAICLRNAYVTPLYAMCIVDESLYDALEKFDTYQSEDAIHLIRKDTTHD